MQSQTTCSVQDMMKAKRTPARVTLVDHSFTTQEVATLRLEWSLGAMDVLQLDIPEFMPELHNTCPGSQPIPPRAPLVLQHNENPCWSQPNYHNEQAHQSILFKL